MQTINVNMTPRASQTKILYCSQDDVGRIATINLLDETGAYEIPSGATVTIRATKPSGLGFEETCAVSGNVVTVTFTETMTQEAGRFPAELRITSGTTVIGTANFWLYCEKNPHPANSTDGTLETIPELTQRIEALNTAIGDLNDLETEETSSIVAAINWLNENGGGTPATTYSVTNRLTNVFNSNGATSIREGRPYSATLSLAQDASLDSISITMGGADITSSAWDASTMAINIASVTNNIVITAVASIVIEVTIGNWTGAGTSRYSGVFDARDYEVYWEIPFVEGASQLKDTATATSNAFGLGVELYNDAEMTQSAGYYYIDVAEIVATKRSTDAQNPTMIFNTQYMIAPSGYYFRIYGIKRGDYNSNGDCFSYIQAYANTLYFRSPHEEPEEDTTSNATRTDNDLLQVYATRSLATDTVSDATTYEGVLEAAKNAWMHEYSGDINKIPLIIHTDQHSTMTPANSSAMWEAIDNMVSWYDISKVINLGDTTNSYENYDDPTLGDSSLDSYLEATQNVPFSKRIEVFGNHDCMKIINASLTYIPTFPSYLNPYFKNVMARRTSNNGFHVTYDPYFNVKYVVVSAYDYVDSTHYDMVSPEQYAWLIEELSKDDGYDIIVCSHVGQPYYYDAQFSNILKARCAKTSGTVTDQLNNSYSYDFTSCQTNLLVFLHGHSHSDDYSYGMGTLSQCFANYYASTRPIYFVIVDRTNSQIKVWKVTNTPEYTTYTRSFSET